ncbi:hypothetical protein ACFV42_46410 [Streptomyces solisilvae]|uniref:hypothetical protein n=1 Tax=Streptomyces malaysiensis TaxID=92644 RepID=UPI0036ADB748
MTAAEDAMRAEHRRQVASLASRDVASALGMLEAPEMRDVFHAQVSALEAVLRQLEEAAQ